MTGEDHGFYYFYKAGTVRNTAKLIRTSCPCSPPKRRLMLNYDGVMKALSCTWLLPLLSQNPILGTLSVPDTRIGVTSEFGTDRITPSRTAAEQLKSWHCFWASLLSFQMLLDSAGAYWNCGRSGVIPYQNAQCWDHLENLAGKTIQGEGKNSSSKTNFRSVFARILKFALEKS